MSGKDALEFVVNQIKRHVTTHKGSTDTTMKISRDLAFDLCKLTSNDIGPLVDKILAKGLDALKEHGLYGYSLDIDLAQEGNVVEFGA